MTEQNNNQLYTLTLNQKQLKALNVACEEYFRVRMGQMNDLADDMSAIGCDFSPENENHDQIFDDFISRRDITQSMLENAFRTATRGRPLSSNAMSDESKICQDIWQVVRHQLWKEFHGNNKTDFWSVASYPPYAVSEMPLPKIKSLQDEKSS